MDDDVTSVEQGLPAGEMMRRLGTDDYAVDAETAGRSASGLEMQLLSAERFNGLESRKSCRRSSAVAQCEIMW